MKASERQSIEPGRDISLDYGGRLRSVANDNRRKAARSDWRGTESYICVRRCAPFGKCHVWMPRSLNAAKPGLIPVNASRSQVFRWQSVFCGKR
jgi:hypothetical protein